jgi:hypothetical protein
LCTHTLIYIRSHFNFSHCQLMRYELRYQAKIHAISDNQEKKKKINKISSIFSLKFFFLLKK